MATGLSAELVSKASAGDPAAIAELLKAAKSDIRRYARKSCRRTSDIEDAVQETLIVLYRNVGALRQVGAISGWLFTIVNRYCIRMTLRLVGLPQAWRAEARDNRIDAIRKPELRLDLARGIESLPDHYREVFLLRDLEELTVDEIADRLGTTRETVKARLHRARTMLREYLADWKS